jgi:IS30 family transposase
MSYRQLTLDERYQIQTLFNQGLRRAAIARELRRSRSTVTRELERNSIYAENRETYYHAEPAQRKTAQRRALKSRRERKIQGELQTLVEQKLRLAWSPEQVSGRLLLEEGVRVSHETIYQHIIRDSKEQSGILRYCLRFGGYKQHRLKKSVHAERTHQRKHHIDQRPVAANERTELGHWERDCVVGTQGGAALLTMVDRKSRFTRIRRVTRLNSDAVADATVDALREHKSLTQTLTNDNGQEFGRDEVLAGRLRVPIYFCTPSSPWQRGSIENLNGLIRQYVRKRTDIAKLHPDLPAALEDALNHRPRKTLGFRTPHEVFHNTETELMSGPLLRLGLEFSSNL